MPIPEVSSRDRLLFFLKESLRNIQSLTTNNLLITNKVTGSYATVTSLTASSATISQESWAAPDLETGWENFSVEDPSTTYADAGYMKDSVGFIHLNGLIRANGSVDSSDPELFTLPAGYRPADRLIKSVWTSFGITRVDINTTGVVKVEDGNTWADDKWISLDSIDAFLAI